MFEWDAAKSARSAATRGLPFELAILLDGPTLEIIDSRKDYGETRTRAIGRIGNVVLACVYTDRDETRRIISLRHAGRKERDAYREAFPD
uniref:BrnT family toxin n=1 Tax=Acidicaldus sp. TaxID=1872105 RepID=A0A8J4HCG3_9PROT